MIFKKKRKKKVAKAIEQYVERVISFSQPIDLSSFKFLNPVTHNIECVFPQELTENWNGKLVLSDVKIDTVATKMFWDDETLDVVILLSFDEMHIFIRNTILHEEENNTIDTNMRKSGMVKMTVSKGDYIDYIIRINKDKMQWFDKARLNAFIRAAGDIDFPVI